LLFASLSFIPSSLFCLQARAEDLREQLDQLGFAELSSLPAATSGATTSQKEDVASRLERLFGMEEPAAYMGESLDNPSSNSSSSSSDLTGGGGAAGSCVAVAPSSGDMAALVRGNRLVVCSARVLSSAAFPPLVVSDGGGGSSYNRRSRGAEWCDVQLLNANGRATALPANGLFTAIGFDAQVKHALN